VVGLAQQRGLVDPARAQGCFDRAIEPAAVVVDHPHAEAQRAAPGDGLADAAHAQDAQRGAVHVGAGEHVVGPVCPAAARAGSVRSRSMRRAVAIISAKPKSAVVSVSTSGALLTSTPRGGAGRQSMLL
jgi:hypothetical protein